MCIMEQFNISIYWKWPPQKVYHYTQLQVILFLVMRTFKICIFNYFKIYKIVWLTLVTVHYILMVYSLYNWKVVPFDPLHPLHPSPLPLLQVTRICSLYPYCSVTKLCPTLCNTIDCSMASFPVLHSLPEFAQTHVH